MNILSNPSESPSLLDLQGSASLWYKVHVFIYDLHHFRTEVASQARVEQVMDPFYLGGPYFNTDEAEILKNTIIPAKKLTLMQHIEESLAERLNRREKKRAGSGDYRVCAAHDIAPILEKALGIDPKRLANDKEFMRILEESGLKLEEEQKWTGVQKKSFNPADKKKGNRKSRK